MNNLDFIFNGKQVVNDGVVIKVNINEEQKTKLLQKKKEGKRLRL